MNKYKDENHEKESRETKNKKIYEQEIEILDEETDEKVKEINYSDLVSDEYEEDENIDKILQKLKQEEKSHRKPLKEQADLVENEEDNKDEEIKIDDEYETTSKPKKVVVKKRLKKINIIPLISFICLIVFLILVIKLNIIPTMYLIILSIILLFIQFIAFLLLNSKKKFLKVLALFIILISIIINTAGSYYLHNTNNFLNKSFNSEYLVNTNTYYIITNATSSNTKYDIEGDVAYYKNTSNIKKANQELEKLYEVNLQAYDDVTSMFTDVKNNKIDFMYVEKSSYSLVFELDKNLKEEDFKVLLSIDVKSKTKLENNEAKEEFNIYIGGTDFTNTNMDFNMIVSINMRTSKVIMTSIPRDYYLELKEYNGKKDTLSYMGPYGIETSIHALENLFDIKIDYYIKVNTTSLVEVVDSIGGITFCSDYEFKTTHALVLNTYNDTVGKKLYVKKGCQDVNGIEALTIARERIALPGRDRARQENCRQILLAIIKKLNNVNTITNYTNILDSFSNLYETSIPREVINNLAKTTLDNKGKWKIIEQAVDGTDKKDYVHMTNYVDWVMEPNLQTVATASKQIKKVVKN